MQNLNIPVILGTARQGRQSEPVAAHVVDVLKARGVITDLIDVADYALTATGEPGDGTNLDHYRELMAAADGIVIVAPEYNHGYPGELKLLLDADYQGYVRKPVAFVSVSSGLIGGTRVTEQLRLVTTALRMVPVAPAVHVTGVADALDDRGRFVENSLSDVLTTMLDEIEWYARVLSPGRAASE